MRNVRSVIIATLLCTALSLLTACTDNRIKVLDDYGVGYVGLQQVDSLAFRTTHHYWKGYQFVGADTLHLLTSPPSSTWEGDTLSLPPGERIVVADIVRSTTEESPDSIWAEVIYTNDTIVLQGWISETTLLTNARPRHSLAAILAPFSVITPHPALGCIPTGTYTHAWMELYLNPTINPFILPWPAALLVVMLWVLLVFLLGRIERHLLLRARYHCGHCGHPIPHLGPCPHCGSINQ